MRECILCGRKQNQVICEACLGKGAEELGKALKTVGIVSLGALALFVLKNPKFLAKMSPEIAAVIMSFVKK